MKNHCRQEENFGGDNGYEVELSSEIRGEKSMGDGSGLDQAS
jgi:hypothetical protein